MTKNLKIGKNGLTLVEVVCCIIIIAIVSNVTLPAIANFRSSEKVKAEAGILVSYMRQSRYHAMQENTLNRIIFAPDDPNLFKVQTLNKDDQIGESSFTELIENSNKDYDDDSSWDSIGDEEEIELDSSVEVIMPDILKAYGDRIYFSPAGYLYLYSTPPPPSHGRLEKISEEKIAFKYGSAVLVVSLNAMGVISSQAFYSNDENIGENDILW